MRILLDINTPAPLARFLRGHDISLAVDSPWRGLENGALLDAAERAGFDVLVTCDQNIPLQQNLQGRKIAVSDSLVHESLADDSSRRISCGQRNRLRSAGAGSANCYALCVRNTGFPASLEIGKLYSIVSDPDAEALDSIRVVDESGEDYDFPACLFERLP